MDYEQWLRSTTKSNGKPLSETSVQHYLSGTKVASDFALTHGLIKKDLYSMTLFELDIAIATILNYQEFKDKDTKGRRMYSVSLKRYRCFRYLQSDKYKEEQKVETEILSDNSLDATTKETVIKARIGQGSFRDKILKKYANKCVITNIDIPQTLIASHIKPWAVCSNSHERVSVNNGILLSATYDKLFDSGLITFNFDGSIKRSSMITSKNAQILNIDDNKKKYDLLPNDEMLSYLDYHHKYVFIDNYR